MDVSLPSSRQIGECLAAFSGGGLHMHRHFE